MATWINGLSMVVRSEGGRGYGQGRVGPHGGARQG